MWQQIVIMLQMICQLFFNPLPPQKDLVGGKWTNFPIHTASKGVTIVSFPKRLYQTRFRKEEESQDVRWLLPAKHCCKEAKQERKIHVETAILALKNRLKMSSPSSVQSGIKPQTWIRGTSLHRLTPLWDPSVSTQSTLQCFHPHRICCFQSQKELELEPETKDNSLIRHVLLIF